MIDIKQVRCDLLRSRKHYIRDSATDELLKSLDNTYYISFFEHEIKKQEETIYNLLHKKMRLDAKLESLVRKNATFTEEYLTTDYDYEKTCKKLDVRFLEYSLLMQSLEEAIELAESEVLKDVV